MTDQPTARDEEAHADCGAADTAGDIRAGLRRTHEALEAAERRHAADRERETMLRGELQHRVRNTLALVRSIFERSIAAGGTIEDLADHFRGRLEVLARYQLSLPHEPAGMADLETMVRDELHIFQAGADPRIAIAGPEVRLAHDAAQATGLALHELATNSIKFGVLGAKARGRLCIEWKPTGPQLDLCWEETGVPVLGQAPLHAGFGRQFIEQALPYQLGAETSFVLKPGGLCCTISLPPGAWHDDPGAK